MNIQGRPCHNCGERTITLYENVRDTFSCDAFSILRCTGCGLDQTFPVPDNLKDYYDTIYYGNRHGFTEQYCIKRRAGIVFSALDNKKADRLLDIGCGDGSFIRYMKQKGFDVAGTEINPDQSLFHDLRVSNGIENLAGSEPFDCITMWHTLEHMPDIGYMFSHVYNLLADNGRLVIAVPNKGSIQSRLFKRMWLHLDVPRHIYHFDSGSLESCLEKSGFNVESVTYQEFEYDLLGWVQSALNSVFKEKNVFFDYLRGRRRKPYGSVNILNIISGFFLAGTFLPLVIAEKIMNNSGTVIVMAGKPQK